MAVKVKTGIYGLNALTNGGFNAHSVTVVIGPAGAGKTTFATQFLRRGLEIGQEAIFVSLDENKEQIIRDAVEMGWEDILDYLKNDMLVFIDASGREFAEFIRKELPGFVEKWKGADARIAIDPLTPVIWSTPERYRQRELIGYLFRQLKKLGTVVVTLEEHGPPDLSSPELVIPIYLADNVIHLRYRPEDPNTQRKLKVVKTRSSKHSELTHEYRIVRGIGIVVMRHGYTPRQTREVSHRLKRELLRRIEGFPPVVREQIAKALDLITDDDLEGVELDELVDSIFEEYL
jgi:KaiC/GvpD/RAD55 family RecA-like ATPase